MDISFLKLTLQRKPAGNWYSELGKIKKKMNSLDKKYEEELERFDFKSIYDKKQDLPGYRWN